jgi:hypothetical protein
VRGQRVHLLRTMLPAGAGRARHGPARTDQVVDHQDRRALDRADQKFAADHPGAAPLFHVCTRDRPGEHRLQHLTKKLGPLHPARVRRGDHDRGNTDKAYRSVGEQTPCVEMNGSAAEGILERNDVVNLERDHAVHPHGLDQLCQGMREDKRLPEAQESLEDMRRRAAHAVSRLPASVRAIEPADPPYAIAISDLLLDHERQVTRRVAQETT